jgi:hypothetical protein
MAKHNLEASGSLLSVLKTKKPLAAKFDDDFDAAKY